MTTLNISLPDTLRDFVEQQVKQGGFSTTSEYIRHLIREARYVEAHARFEQLLHDGMQSGQAEPLKDEEWDALRLRVAEERVGYETDPRRVAEEQAGYETDPRRVAEERVGYETDPRRVAEERVGYETDPRRVAEEQAGYKADPPHLDSESVGRMPEQEEK